MDTTTFKMGWLMVAFDLPTKTKDERKRYTHFRKCLLDDGFLMMQYSVYIRP
ncbi:MAG: CRISPR-associated endonuclease Cas2 [Akkermansiaceae bacterium]